HEHGPQWWVLADEWPAAAEHRGVQDLVADLNHTYRATPALWEQDTTPDGFTWLDGNAADENVIAFVRHAADGSPLVAVSNFSPVVRHDQRIGLPLPGRWRTVLDTDDARYGGSDAAVATRRPTAEPVPWHGQDHSARLTLPPLATIWLTPEEHHGA
ncbi:alpha amylase C-terminal domain-containing protein, partial [Kitasatospora cinereorecta]